MNMFYICSIFFMGMFGYNFGEKFMAYYLSPALTPFMISLIVFSVYIALAAGSLVSGYLMERLGLVRCMRYGILLYVPFMLALALSDDLPALVVTAAFVGIGGSLFHNAGDAYVLSSTKSKGASMGLLKGAVRLGDSAAAILGAWLSTFTSFSNMALLGAGVIALSSIMTVRVKDHAHAFDKFKLSSEFDIFMQSDMLAISAFSLLMSLFSGVMVTIIPIMAKDAGAAAFDVGVLFFIVNIISFVTAYKAGAWGDRKGRKPIYAVSFAAFALSMFMLVHTQSYAAIFAVSVLFSLVQLALRTTISASLGDLFAHSLPMAVSMNSFAATIGVALGALMAGALSITDFRLPFLALGMLFSLSLVLVWKMKIR